MQIIFESEQAVIKKDGCVYKAWKKDSHGFTIGHPTVCSSAESAYDNLCNCYNEKAAYDNMCNWRKLKKEAIN